MHHLRTHLHPLGAKHVPERQRSMEAVQESEARLSAILEHLPVGVGVMDQDGDWVHLNAEMRRFMGSRIPSRDPEIGRLWRGFDQDGRLLDPSQYPGERALRGETRPPPVDFVTEVTGEPRWVRVKAAPIPGDGEEVEEAIVTLQDITEQRRNEDRIRESEKRLATALRAGKLEVYDHDLRTDRAEWGGGVRSLWGIPDDEAVTYATFLAGIHPDDVRSVDRSVAVAFDPDGSGSYEAEYRVVHRQTGQVRWVRAAGDVSFESATPARIVGIVVDITEQKQAEQHRDLLMRELSHRVKNTLAVVESLVIQTDHVHSIDEYKNAFVGRLRALAQAQNLLAEASWQRTRLEDLVEQTVRAFRGCGLDVIELVGEAVTVSAEQALRLALILHELGTNAVKYGALSNAEGRLRVGWWVEDAQNGPEVRLEWRERNGPPVTPAKSKGFGTELIEGVCDYELDGEARLDYAPEGLTCRIRFPLDKSGRIT